MLLLIGATTGFAEDFYSGVSKEDIFRHHSTNWIVTLDNNQMPIDYLINGAWWLEENK